MCDVKVGKVRGIIAAVLEVFDAVTVLLERLCLQVSVCKVVGFGAVSCGINGFCLFLY